MAKMPFVFKRERAPVPSYPPPLKSAQEIVDLQVRGDAVALAHELGRVRDIVFYLVGTIEGIAERHSDVRPTAAKARRLLGKDSAA